MLPCKAPASGWWPADLLPLKVHDMPSRSEGEASALHPDVAVPRGCVSDVSCAYCVPRDRFQDHRGCVDDSGLLRNCDLVSPAVCRDQLSAAVVVQTGQTNISRLRCRLREHSHQIRQMINAGPKTTATWNKLPWMSQFGSNV